MTGDGPKTFKAEGGAFSASSSVAATATGARIKAAPYDNSPGNHGSYMVAIKIG